MKLTRTGQTDIPGTGVNVTSLSTLTCGFDVTGRTPGQWNVVVTNPDGQSGTLVGGLGILLPASVQSLGAGIRSALDPAMTMASSRYRFKFWGKATVIDLNTIQLDDGSSDTIRVTAQGHTGIADGHFACAVGTLITTPDGPILLSSADQVSVLD